MHIVHDLSANIECAGLIYAALHALHTGHVYLLMNNLGFRGWQFPLRAQALHILCHERCHSLILEVQSDEIHSPSSLFGRRQSLQCTYSCPTFPVIVRIARRQNVAGPFNAHQDGYQG